MQLGHLETINWTTLSKNIARLDTATVGYCETEALCNWDTVRLYNWITFSKNSVRLGTV